MKGTATAMAAFFLPNLSASHPNTGVPTMAPTQKVEATSEACNTVRGAPRGEKSGSLRIGREGETQPIAQPWLKVMMFTGKWNNFVLLEVLEVIRSYRYSNST